MTRNDASLIPQPTYVDLWNAYIAGAKDAIENPKVNEYQISRAADAYCKLFHLSNDPAGFRALGLTEGQRETHVEHNKIAQLP